jgi:ribokinase
MNAAAPAPAPRQGIVILGIFAADLAFRATRLPAIGETLIGETFQLGAGGKGSNQAVAAARAGGAVRFVTRIGADAFGEIALRTWREAGVDTRHVVRAEGESTGAAFIYVSALTGDNAIIVVPGAAGGLSPADIEAAEPSLREAGLFVTQLEQPLAAVEAGLRAARRLGVPTLLNPAPAPAGGLPDALLALCDHLTPNETEAEALTGIAIRTPADALRAARALRARGAGTVAVTLGAQGAVLVDATQAVHVPAQAGGPVVDTTGAGDAFNGAYAVALVEGRGALEAVRLANAAAGLSVTRPGTAAAMAPRAEIDAALARAPAPLMLNPADAA